MHGDWGNGPNGSSDRQEKQSTVLTSYNWKQENPLLGVASQQQ
jgi:hypothetical protein